MRDDDVRKKDYLQRRIEPISPKATGSIDDFLRRLGGCSFQGRALSRCLDVLEAMTTDDGCLLVMTLSGALVPGGMEQTIVELIEEGVIDLLVTTGANVSHSMVNHADEENQGHFVGAPSADDADLFRHAINRIYDTFLPEEGYHKGEMLLEALLREHFDESGIDPTTPWRVTPSELFGIVGSGLEKLGRHGLLASAHRFMPS